MDISIIYSLIAIFLPLFFGIYLLNARIRLSLVPRNILNCGLVFVNSISLSLFLYLYYFVVKNSQDILSQVNIFTIDKLAFNIGIDINESNLKFIIFTSLVYLFISLYSVFYFGKKKQYIFTKQRFYIFLSFLIFNTFIFLASSNLFQSLVFWILQGVIIFIFAYFDIFKFPTNFNITRFQRISLIGDFSFIFAILILFKYVVLSKDYIHSLALDLSELNEIMSYVFGISENIEFKLCTIFLLIAIMSKMFIFPLSCYYSFFANSSNIFYLSIVACANSIFGAYVFIKALPFFDLLNNYGVWVCGFILLTVLLCFISIFFEKSFKIIFGYLYSIYAASFVVAYYYLRSDIVIYAYFLISFVTLLILMSLFINDKVNLNKRLINKTKGFMLERTHILFFEVIPLKIFKILNFIDEKIVQNFVEFIMAIFSYLISLFNIKTIKNDSIKAIRNILIIIAFFALLAIFIALFGRYR